MSSKFKIEATVTDEDTENSLTTDDIKSDVTQLLTELELDIEGEITVIKVES